mgnify:CR=1 FL=1
MNVDPKDLVGFNLPDARVTKISLQSSAAPVKTNRDNPHIVDMEMDLDELVVGAGAGMKINQADSKPMKVVLDIAVNDVMQKGFSTTWSTNFNLKQYLKIVVIRADHWLPLKRWSNNIKDSEPLESNPLSKPDGQNGVVFKKSISMTEFTNENPSVTALETYTTTTPNNKQIIQYTFQIEDEVATTTPQTLAYLICTTFDMDKLAEDYDFDPTWGVADEEIRLLTEGTPRLEVVFANSTLKNTGVIYTTTAGDLWPGPVFHQPGGTVTQDVDGEEILTKTVVSNPKIKDNRQIPKRHNFPITLNQTMQSLFPRSITKIAGQENLLPPLESAYFSDILITNSDDVRGNNKVETRLFFGLDMGEIIRNKSQFGMLASQNVGSMLKAFLNKTSIRSLKVLRRTVDPSTKYKDPVTNRITCESVNPNTPDYCVIEAKVLHQEQGPGTASVNHKIESLLGPAQKNAPGVENIQGREFDPDAFNMLNENVWHYTFRDANVNQHAAYQYRVELEVVDGGFLYLKEKYELLNVLEVPLALYYSTATIPKMYDATAGRFVQGFEQKVTSYKESVNSVISTVVEVVSMLTAAADPTGPAPNFNQIAKRLYWNANSKTGSPGGILILQQTLKEVMTAMERLLDLQRPTSNSKTSPQGKQDPSNSSSDLRTIQISHEWDTVYYSGQQDMGYTFLNADTGWGTKIEIAQAFDGLKTMTGESFENRATLETAKFFKEPETSKQFQLPPPFEVPLVIEPNTTMYTYLSPSSVHFGAEQPLNVLPWSAFHHPTDGTLDDAVNPLKAVTDVIVYNQGKHPLSTLWQNMEQVMADIGCVAITDQQAELIATEGDDPHQAGIGPAVTQETPLSELIEDIKWAEAIEQKEENKSIAAKQSAQALAGVITKMTISPAVVKDPTTIQSPQGGDLQAQPGYIDTGFALDGYDLTSPLSILNKEAFGNITPQQRQAIINQLPNQIKALIAAKVETIVSALPGTMDGAVNYNPFIPPDPFKSKINPGLMDLKFWFAFQNLVKIQYLEGYETSASGPMLGPIRNFLKKPLWKDLTSTSYNNNLGTKIICRLVRWKDPSWVRPWDERFMDLPIYDQYFLMELPGKVEVNPPSTPPPPLGHLINNTLEALDQETIEQTEHIHTDQGMTFPDPADGQGVDATGQLLEELLGGGY